MFRGYGASDIGKQRKHNEDTFLINIEAGLFGVADGVGGDGRGKIASLRVMDAFQEEMDTFSVLKKDFTRLQGLRIITEINQKLSDHGDALRPPRDLATTFTALIIRDPQIAWLLHVGDSRLYGLDYSGRLEPLTGEHTLAAELKKQGQVEIDPRTQDALVNCMGRLRPDWHEVLPLVLDDYRAFLICSDGLNKMVAHQELEKIMVNNWKQPANGVQYLIDAALNVGGEDNITALIVVREEDLET